MSNFPNIIKELRKNKNLTQSDLAKQLGLTRASVNAWEIGAGMPSIPVLVKISETFNVSTDYLLGMPESKSMSLDGLDDGDIAALHAMAEHLREKNRR